MPELLAGRNSADVALGLPGLIGFWRLAERAGTVARDLTARHDGTYTASPTLGARGFVSDGISAITVNGSSQYVTIVDDAVYSIGAGMSWDAWIRPTSSAALSFFLAKGIGGAWEWGFGRGLAPFNAGTGVVMIAWQSGGTSYATAGTLTGTVPDNAWSHVAATIVPAVSIKAYVNGRLLSTSTSFSGTMGPDGTSAVNIGRRPAADRYYTGDVQDARIWRRALSAGEIADLYYAGRG